MEERQKKIMAQQQLPHSPVRAPREFPAPPHVYNPLEDLSYQQHFHEFGPGVEEEDFGGREEEPEAGDDETNEGEGDGQEEGEDDDDDDEDDEDDE